MKRSFAMLTSIVSPQLLPLGAAIAKQANCSSFGYYAVGHMSDLRRKLGWRDSDERRWVRTKPDGQSYQDFVRENGFEDVDVLLLTLRDYKLIRLRAERGLCTWYMSERWFKPPLGMWRLLSPRYFVMAYRMARLIVSGRLRGLPTGVYAARDMARLCGLISGDLRCLFRAPKISYEHITGGSVMLGDGSSGARYGLPNMRMWAYYVDGTRSANACLGVKVMWVGRFLQWKHVEDIIRACIIAQVPLDLYGAGPAKAGLEKRFSQESLVSFHGSLNADEVREQMRQHSIYVLSSDAYEGWGVVINEAMLEGMAVVGSRAAGAPPTMIEDGVNGLLFEPRDVKGLAACLKMLKNDEYRRRLALAGQSSIRANWVPDRAAEFLVACT